MSDNNPLMDEWATALAEQQAASAPGQTLSTAEMESLFPSLESSPGADAPGKFDLIMDLPVTMTVELGRTEIAISDLLQLAQGSIVELDGLAGEPMHVLINGKLVALGEVVVVNDKFGIRLTDIVAAGSRGLKK